MEIVKEKSTLYESLMMLLTANQFHLLKAIAEEGVVNQPQSRSFSAKHNLPSASSIKKSLDFLTDKELVYRTPDGYIIYDRFLGIWIQRL